MQTTLSYSSYGFAGLGLIGGSIARAIRAVQPDARILVYDPDDATLAYAEKDGVASDVTSLIGPKFTNLDVIFLCAPVTENNKNIELLLPHLSGDTTLTDIGSVKGAIHKKVIELGIEGQFVGGHPMAGSERRGYANASETLLENAYYCLTHTDGVEPVRIAEMEAFVRMIGAIPVSFTAAEHDFVTGAVSHVPHVISAALVNLVHDADDKDDTLKRIAAGGFKDITRISSSSPAMWQQICEENRDVIVELLDRYLERLNNARDLIANRSANSIYSFFEEARAYRESFTDTVAGPITQQFLLYVDIRDTAGALSNTIKLLSDIGINLKNIGITHNREAAFGSLMIEFYDNTARNLAINTLRANGYIVSLPE